MDHRNLIEALLVLETPEEMKMFLSDLCTPKELRDMSQRLEAAKRLYHGEKYDEIHAESGLSSTTIARINAEVQYGAGGYRTVIERLEKR